MPHGLRSGARAVDLLLDRSEKPETSAGSTDKSIVFPVELVHRASVAPPPSAERVVPPMR